MAIAPQPAALPVTVIFGGSFNPPHVGHAMVAAWLRWTQGVSAVWFVPAFEHAFGKELAPWDRRLRATRALAAMLNDGGDWAGVSDIEVDLPRPSYTIRTLDTLRSRNPDRRLRLVVGSDVWEQFGMWRDHERVIAEYSPIVVGRAGYPEIPGVPSFPDVSSSVIRERLARGESVSGLVPGSVLRQWIG